MSEPQLPLELVEIGIAIRNLKAVFDRVCEQKMGVDELVADDVRNVARKSRGKNQAFAVEAHPVLDRSAAIERDENEISLDDLDALAQFIQDHAPDEEPEALRFERILKWLEYRRAIHF